MNDETRVNRLDSVILFENSNKRIKKIDFEDPIYTELIKSTLLAKVSLFAVLANVGKFTVGQASYIDELITVFEKKEQKAYEILERMKNARGDFLKEGLCNYYFKGECFND